MVITKSSRRHHPKNAVYVTPAAVSSPSLLRAGSDRAFQELVFDLFTVSARLEEVRTHLARKMGISAPQYSVLRAVAALQGEDGVSIGVVAEHLHVSSAFITTQSRLLAQLGLLEKKDDARDRRVSRLSLTTAAQRLVDDAVQQVRPINDMFFGILDRGEFDSLVTIMDKLVRSSRGAIAHLSSESPLRTR
jgi:DNA-binding MarR family transcriptional regulator